jgi:hypothetical protein
VSLKSSRLFSSPSFLLSLRTGPVFCGALLKMTTTNITFADGLAKVKTNASGDGDNFGIGGVYNLRARRSSKASSQEVKAGFFADEKAVPHEDEDPGLRNEGDYKSKQVRLTVISVALDISNN